MLLAELLVEHVAWFFEQESSIRVRNQVSILFLGSTQVERKWRLEQQEEYHSSLRVPFAAINVRNGVFLLRTHFTHTRIPRLELFVHIEQVHTLETSWLGERHTNWFTWTSEKLCSLARIELGKQCTCEYTWSSSIVHESKVLEHAEKGIKKEPLRHCTLLCVLVLRSNDVICDL